MPIFEYHCPACGKTVERIERQPAVAIDCPACGAPAPRIVSAFAPSVPTGGGCAAPSGSGFS